MNLWGACPHKEGFSPLYIRQVNHFAKLLNIEKDQPTIILHLVGIVIGLTTCAVISGMGRMLVLLSRLSGWMSYPDDYIPLHEARGFSSRSGALIHSDSKHYCKRTVALETKQKCNEIIRTKARRKAA